MERKSEAVALVATIIKDAVIAEKVIDRLQDEGLLHLGYGNADVDQIVGAFKEVFGTTKTTRYDRFAATRLAKVHTAQNVVGVIKMLAQVAGDKYVPTVGNVAQLEEKWVNVIAYLRKQGQQREEIQL